MAGVIFDGNTVAPALLIKEEVAKTKFGVSIDSLLGSVDADGVYSPSDETFTVDLSGIKSFSDGAGLVYRFYGNKQLRGTIDLSNLVSSVASDVGIDACFNKSGIEEIILPPRRSGTHIFTSNGIAKEAPFLRRVVLNSDVYSTNELYYINYAFEGCAALTEIVGLEKAQLIENFGFVFRDCTSLQMIDVSGITTINGGAVAGWGMYATFSGCTSLSGTLYFTNLQSVGTRGLTQAFMDCPNLQAAYFPALTSVTTDAFGRNSTYATFRNCSGMTEIHFRADMQATIEAMANYSSKFGATNATIYFSL